MLHVSERVCIRALTVAAHEVFESSEKLQAALVRELIHDRLMMRSVFDITRDSIRNDGYFHVYVLQSCFYYHITM